MLGTSQLCTRTTVHAACRKLVWEELQGRAREKAAAEAKKARDARDALASLMRHSRDVTERSSFDEAREALGRKSEWRAVRAPAVGLPIDRQVFNEGLDALSLPCMAVPCRQPANLQRPRQAPWQLGDHEQGVRQVQTRWLHAAGWAVVHAQMDSRQSTPPRLLTPACSAPLLDRPHRALMHVPQRA